MHLSATRTLITSSRRANVLHVHMYTEKNCTVHSYVQRWHTGCAFVCSVECLKECRQNQTMHTLLFTCHAYTLVRMPYRVQATMRTVGFKVEFYTCARMCSYCCISHVAMHYCTKLQALWSNALMSHAPRACAPYHTTSILIYVHTQESRGPTA